MWRKALDVITKATLRSPARWASTVRLASSLEVPLPRPGKYLNDYGLLEDMRVLLFSNTQNRLTNKVTKELQNLKINTKNVTVGSNAEGYKMVQAFNDFKPSVVICPFLTFRVPDVICESDVPCLIVHPGIAGDRGSSSLDWALRNKSQTWGATCLQARGKLDSGEIWSTEEFEINNPKTVTKTGLYNGPIVDAAVDIVLDSLVRFQKGIPPKPLDYSHPEVQGTFQRRMQDNDRTIDWQMPVEDINSLIRCSDTQPGALGELSLTNGNSPLMARLYGSNIASSPILLNSVDCKAGDVIAKKNESILVVCGPQAKDAIWVSALKKTDENAIKLPATEVIGSNNLTEIPEIDSVYIHHDINVHKCDDVAFVHFNFYNGAMSVAQCKRLQNTLQELSNDNQNKMIVLMGGERFFSTGIHLNKIEVSSDPAQESWENINAIDDVIKTIFSMDSIVVSALQGDAAAGGIMMALSADFVYAHLGTMMTPSYKAMSLYGSEYWTYSLPERVGDVKARELTSGEDTLTASQALNINLIDGIIGRNRFDMLQKLPTMLNNIPGSVLERLMADKRKKHNTAFYNRLELHRDIELRYMKECFSSASYNKARHNFVYKK